MSSAASTPTTVKETHLLRGILWGIPFGLGLVIVLLVTKVIPLDPVWMAAVFVGGIVVGALWSTLGPAKAPKGPPPIEPPPADGQPVAATSVPPAPTSADPSVDTAGDVPPPPPDAPGDGD